LSRRKEFHAVLCGIGGIHPENVYFQPPENLQMVYPCIRYERSMQLGQNADDRRYVNRQAYSVMIIDPDPDNPAIDGLAAMPLSTYDRHYTMNNLHHDVFYIYY